MLRRLKRYGFVLTAEASKSAEKAEVIKRVETGCKRKENKKEERPKKKRNRKKSDTKSGEAGSDKKELSDSDKQLLDRWKNMQSNTKPFIHPIRKYMGDILALKKEGHDEEAAPLSEKNHSQLPHDQRYQFTTYLSEKGNGESLKAVKDSNVSEHTRGSQSMFVLGKLHNTM